MGVVNKSEAAARAFAAANNVPVSKVLKITTVGLSGFRSEIREITVGAQKVIHTTGGKACWKLNGEGRGDYVGAQIWAAVEAECGRVQP